MIKCFVVLCMVSNPTICKAPVEIFPDDGHPIASPMECARGGLSFFSQARIEDNPDTPTSQGNREKLVDGLPAPGEWFAKTYNRMEGDGSDIIRSWVAEEKRKALALEPQIK